MAESTIVFYYGDNGGVLPRSKRFIYETGTQIPLVIRIPEKYKYLFPAAKPGDKVDRIVNFVDFLPTVLSIAGVTIPHYIQGKAFLGKQKTADPEYTFMSRQRMGERYDNVRAVRDKQYRYIRNYMPFRITIQHVEYMFNAIGAQSWENAFKQGKTNEVQSRYFREKPVEELYDTENDPWEIHNLAGDPEYAGILKRMSAALVEWRKETYDIGVIPETEYKVLAGTQPMYDYIRSEKCPFEKLLKASDLAILGNKDDIKTYIAYLYDENSAVRYWGVAGLLWLKEAARPALNELKNATNDKSVAVATLAAEALFQLGEKQTAIQAYLRFLDIDNYDSISINFALNSIDVVGDNSPELKAAVIKLIHDLKLANYLVKKWESI